MSTFETARHQVAIAGRVSDARTARPLAGVLVRIVAGPPAFTNLVATLAQHGGASWGARAERLDQTVTPPDGHFAFLDLPNGQYAVTASLPTTGTRYGTRSLQVTVSRDERGALRVGRVDLTVPPTTLEGRVTRASGGPLSMADVQIRGGERAKTDAEGRYVLSPLETGTRHVIAASTGFQSLSRTVTFAAPGTTKTLDFTLTAVAP